MSRFNRISERDLERLLVGRVPAGDDQLVGVVDFISNLKAAFAEEPVPGHTEADHLAAMLAAAHLLAANGDPAARPAGTSNEPAGQPSGRPRWERSPFCMRLRTAPLAAKLAAASATLVMLFSGLAFAGALPAPVQGFVSRAASSIGLHIPHPAQKPSDVASPTPQPRPSAVQSPTGAQNRLGPRGEAQIRHAARHQSQTGQQGQGGTQGQDQGGGQGRPQGQGNTQGQDQGGSQGQDEGGSPGQDEGGSQGQGNTQGQDQGGSQGPPGSNE